MIEIIREIEKNVVGKVGSLAKVKEIRNNEETNNKDICVYDLYLIDKDGNEILLASDCYDYLENLSWEFSKVENAVLRGLKPTDNWLKDEIIEYLKCLDIEYKETMTKAELLELIEV